MARGATSVQNQSIRSKKQQNKSPQKSHAQRNDLLSHFPNIAAECLIYGPDITSRSIPVVPAAHYMGGGVQAGLQGRQMCLACMWLVRLHGANRLASNSLLDEALVFARRAVHPSIDHMKSVKLDLSAPSWWSRPTVPKSFGSDVMYSILSTTKKVKKELQSIMWKYVGIVRSTTRQKTAEH